MENRIVELALETLQGRLATVETEIGSIQAQLKGGTSPKTVAPATGKRKARTAAQRKAQSKRMKSIWAEKRAKAAKVRIEKKATPSKPKKGLSTAVRKEQSERMRAYWAKRKAGE